MFSFFQEKPASSFKWCRFSGRPNFCVLKDAKLTVFRNAFHAFPSFLKEMAIAEVTQREDFNKLVKVNNLRLQHLHDHSANNKAEDFNILLSKTHPRRHRGVLGPSLGGEVAMGSEDTPVRRKQVPGTPTTSRVASWGAYHEVSRDVPWYLHRTYRGYAKKG